MSPEHSLCAGARHAVILLSLPDDPVTQVPLQIPMSQKGGLGLLMTEPGSDSIVNSYGVQQCLSFHLCSLKKTTP